MSKKKKIILMRVLAVLLLIGIAAAMMVIGRGHTVYFDNKKIEYEGQTYDCPYKVTVYKDGERVAKLLKKDRGMVEIMDSKIKVTLEIVNEKGEDPIVKTVTFPLKYSWDGTVINLPAYLNKLPMDVFMTEFIPAAVTEEPTEETVDEFGLTGMEG